MITEKQTRYGKSYIISEEVKAEEPRSWQLPEEINYDEIEDIKESIQKKKKLVEEVMLGWDETKNYDRILDFECLRTEFRDIKIHEGKENIVIHIPKKIMRLLPSPETYTRARRAIIKGANDNEDWELLKKLMPTKEWIIKRRAKQEKVIREFFAREDQ